MLDSIHTVQKSSHASPFIFLLKDVHSICILWSPHICNSNLRKALTIFERYPKNYRRGGEGGKFCLSGIIRVEIQNYFFGTTCYHEINIWNIDLFKLTSTEWMRCMFNWNHNLLGESKYHFPELIYLFRKKDWFQYLVMYEL